MGIQATPHVYWLEPSDIRPNTLWPYLPRFDYRIVVECDECGHQIKNVHEGILVYDVDVNTHTMEPLTVYFLHVGCTKAHTFRTSLRNSLVRIEEPSAEVFEPKPGKDVPQVFLDAFKDG